MFLFQGRRSCCNAFRLFYFTFYWRCSNVVAVVRRIGFTAREIRRRRRRWLYHVVREVCFLSFLFFPFLKYLFFFYFLILLFSFCLCAYYFHVELFYHLTIFFLFSNSFFARKQTKQKELKKEKHKQIIIIKKDLKNIKRKIEKNNKFKSK